MKKDDIELIKFCLRSCLYNDRDDQVFYVYKHGNLNRYPHPISPSIVFEVIEDLNPLSFFPPDFYDHPSLSRDMLDILVRELRKKKIEATRRQVQEMAFAAHDAYENNGEISSRKHAINYTIKGFRSGEWKTPFGFDEIIQPCNRLVSHKLLNQ